MYRPAGAASVTVSNVTDLRLNEQYCGLLRDGVTSIPTDQLQSQVDALLEQLRQNLEQAASGQLIDGSVTTSKLADGAVTNGKTDFSAGFSPAGPIRLTKGVHYFDSEAELPDALEEGRIYFVALE